MALDPPEARLGPPEARLGPPEARLGPHVLPAAARSSLVHLGQRLRPRPDALIRAAVSHLQLGRWLYQRGLKIGTRVRGREGVFDVALARLAGAQSVLYLEFGVYRGETLQYWTQRLVDPTTRFVGFDSFQGLPERWRSDMPRGRFSTEGALPYIEDERVSLVPGWFDETVPMFEVPAHEQLVVNVDADLYSSARTVLTALEPVITKGTMLYFDEFNDGWNELRALDEFLDRTGSQVEVLAVSRCWCHWLFRCVG